MAQGVTLTDTETEVYSGNVLKRYQHLDYVGTDKCMFFGMKPTETVNIPVTQTGDAENLDDGTDHVGSAEIIGQELTLDLPLKSFNTVKQRQVDTRPDLGMLAELGAQHGRNIGRGRTIRILNGLAAHAEAQSNRVDVDAAGSSDLPASVKNGIKAVGAAMDADGVDPFGRWGMLKSSLWYELYDSDSVISVDFGGQAGRQTAGGNMGMINYMNFDIRNVGVAFGTNFSNSDWDHLSLPDNTGSAGVDLAHDMTDVLGVFWQRDAWAARHQTGLAISTPYIAEKQVWLIMARLQFGFKVIHNEGVYVLMQGSEA